MADPLSAPVTGQAPSYALRAQKLRRGHTLMAYEGALNVTVLDVSGPGPDLLSDHPLGWADLSLDMDGMDGAISDDLRPWFDLLQRETRDLPEPILRATWAAGPPGLALRNLYDYEAAFVPKVRQANAAWLASLAPDRREALGPILAPMLDAMCDREGIQNAFLVWARWVVRWCGRPVEEGTRHEAIVEPSPFGPTEGTREIVVTSTAGGGLVEESVLTQPDLAVLVAMPDGRTLADHGGSCFRTVVERLEVGADGWLTALTHEERLVANGQEVTSGSRTVQRLVV